MLLPKVSVIIPAFNAEKTIIKTLDSVFDQTYANLEIIVVNDGSTDHTPTLLKNYGDKITLISTENRGVSYARNLGFKKATGDFIQYLDSNDLLLPDKLLLQVSALLDHNADVAYGDWQRFTAVNNEISVKETITKRIKDNVEIDLFTDFWCPPAVLLYSRRITEKLTWNEKLPIIQDARYLLDAAIFKGKFIYTAGLMAMYREGQQNSLSQKSEAAFITDCFYNCKDIYKVWHAQLQSEPKKLDAIIRVLRFCINRLSVVKPTTAKEAINFLLHIAPNYVPNEKGSLRIMSQLFGYKNAEHIAGIKRRFKK